MEVQCSAHSSAGLVRLSAAAPVAICDLGNSSFLTSPSELRYELGFLGDERHVLKIGDRSRPSDEPQVSG
ncbi:hypothetical protein INR49_023416 [Caranx melampygus]|nr:hypothetical protein INR49_023416 [Caranx melampygus]